METVEITFEAYANPEYSNICYDMYEKIKNGQDYREDREKFRKFVAKQTEVYLYYPTDWILWSEDAIVNDKLSFEEFEAALYGTTILSINNHWLSEVNNLGSYKEPDSDNYERRTLKPLEQPIKYTPVFKCIAETIYKEVQKEIHPYDGAGRLLQWRLENDTEQWFYYPTDWVCECRKAIKEELFSIEDFCYALYGVSLLAVNNGWISEVTQIEEELVQAN